MLVSGDPAPWFVAPSNVSPKFHFDTVAGRYVVLSFFGSAMESAPSSFLQAVADHANFFDVENRVFCGVSNLASDTQRLATLPTYMGIRFFADFDFAIARRYGLMELAHLGERIRPTTFVLDEGLRVLAIFPLEEDGASHFQKIAEYVGGLPALALSSKTAPVLSLDRVFELELCLELIGIYEKQGGYESGFMREIDGKTTAVSDFGFKRRSDCEVADQGIIRRIHERLQRRVIPEIKKAFNFSVTRIERHIVACYDAEQQGHFNPHRDNTSKGTAHRRFAVSINLNAEDYEGGNLRFPEYGPRLYRPSTGGAVVFGCSLLHEATQVIRGKRYAFLPFLYDDEGARIREQNRSFLSDKLVDLNR